MKAAAASTRKSADIADALVNAANEDELFTSAAQDLASFRPVLAALTPDEVSAALKATFTEKNGQYWGPPENDQAAIRELKRLRKRGAKLIAFTWPTFWWLQHYSGFNRYLRSEFRCAVKNDFLIVFDLH